MKKLNRKTPLKAAQEFWGDAKTIKWFHDEPAPKYWIEFLSKLGKKRNKKVLDLGCGAGRNSEMAVNLGFDLLACDLQIGMVNTTIKRLKLLSNKKDWGKCVIVASMLGLPYPNNSFDVIISNGVYHNTSDVDEIDKALNESARVLKRGGSLCFNLFSSEFIAPELKMVKLKPNTYVTNEGLHMTLISKEQFLALAQKNGLILEGEVTQYRREVTTGVRAVMRGVLVKN